MLKKPRNHDLLQAEKDSLYSVFNCDLSNALHTSGLAENRPAPGNPPQTWGRKLCLSEPSPLEDLQVLQHARATSTQKPTPALLYIFVVTLASNGWMAVFAHTAHSSPWTPQMNCLDFGCRHLFSARYSATHVRDRRETNGWHWVGAPAVKWSCDHVTILYDNCI